MLRGLGEEKGEQRGVMNTEAESGLGPDQQLVQGSVLAGGACTGAGALIQHPEMCLIFYLLEKNLFPFSASLKI